MAMMERGVGKIEVSVHDEHAVVRVLHLDPDQTFESVHDQLRELTGLAVETQVLSFQGQALYDRRSVHDYNIKPCSTLYLKKVSRDCKRELLMQQAILWDDGCKVQTLIDEGYDVTTPFSTLSSGPMGDTSVGAHPLHFAALCLSASSLTVLLRNGAPTEAKCEEAFVGPEKGRSALRYCTSMHIAACAASATGGDAGCITHLLLHDADVDAKCERANMVNGSAYTGCTALHVACALANEHVIATLLERNADLEAFCFEGAAIKTCRELVEQLVATRQITAQAGIRDFSGDKKDFQGGAHRLYGKTYSVSQMY